MVVRMWVEYIQEGNQMIFQESETVELKSIAVDEIKKEIIAIT